jgi:hypothetical protein
MSLLIPATHAPVLTDEKTFYMADAAARLYHPAAYYAAKV